ncbi:uncharacterized protein N7500_003872 [Penicillium coprophilum]|uniref:uncharacterized protein n=1 Tax=Penicillium coprophilum TaxID=36646 RepID=UPI0023999D37|nr:uncharacterized protein N7500_003872 [Penicillium coprophilum]KAJ5171089.1 hypothetical protein N7500_003872 [Penicillium coprophilum]
MDRALATRSGSHVSSAGIGKQDLRSRRAVVGPDSPNLRLQGEFRNHIPGNDEYLDERHKNVTL